jgi:hypothetical protein
MSKEKITQEHVDRVMQMAQFLIVAPPEEKEELLSNLNNKLNELKED